MREIKELLIFLYGILLLGGIVVGFMDIRFRVIWREDRNCYPTSYMEYLVPTYMLGCVLGRPFDEKEPEE